MGLTLIGALGYRVIEGWSFADGIYMAVTTMTTVGFREVHELTWPGRIWTMILALTSIGIIFGSVALVAEDMVTQVASGQRKAKRMQRKINHLSDHFVVCGFGRVGSLVARELTEDGYEVVVIDTRADSLQRAEAAGYLVVPGDGATDEVLQQAGAERARGLVTAIDSDAENVYVTIAARTLNPKLFIVARAGTKNVIAKLLQAGADRAVSPYTMAGRRIVNLALKPGVIAFIDAALARGKMSIGMEEVAAHEGDLAGRTIGALRAEGILTLAVLTGPGQLQASPPDDQVIEAGQHLIVSGATEVLDRLTSSLVEPDRSWQADE